MPVHPQVAAILESMDTGVSIMDLGLDTIRRYAGTGMAATAMAPEVQRVEERRIDTAYGEVPIRLYWPHQEQPTPLLVWFHGGGFVLGDLESANPTARDLCSRSGVIVASVDYPLAPEHPFPAAPEACWSVTRWLVDHAEELGVDPGRVAVGGDSAGGNLAAVVALLARDRGGPPLVFQLLVYPTVDFRGDYPSARDNGSGYLLTTEMREFFHDNYFRSDAEFNDPRASPILAPLAGLPPALVLTAEFDPLRDEGEAYAERLRQAGVEATATRYDGMIHGFFGYTALVDRARDAMDDAASALRKALDS